jgi:hypothetical protein
MNMRDIRIFLCLMAAVTMPSVADDNDHLLPDITGFENLFVAYRYAGSASITSLKGQKEAGGKEQALRAVLHSYRVGFKKERVDNRYSLVSFTYTTSEGGETDYTNSPITIDNMYSIKYGEGRHIGKKANMDWNIFISLDSADMSLGFESTTEIGVGIGAELAYSVTSWIDLNAEVNVNSIYNSISLGGDINF